MYEPLSDGEFRLIELEPSHIRADEGHSMILCNFAHPTTTIAEEGGHYEAASYCWGAKMGSKLQYL